MLNALEFINVPFSILALFFIAFAISAFGNYCVAFKTSSKSKASDKEIFNAIYNETKFSQISVRKIKSS